MAELIDKNELEKRMTEDWFLEILVTQYSKNSVKKDIENAIENLPTTTESDIRAKALNEVLEKVKVMNLWDSRDKDMFRLVVEQLKEE